MTQRKQTTVRFGRKFVRAERGSGEGAEIARLSNLLERCQRSLAADIYLPLHSFLSLPVVADTDIGHF